MEELAKVEKFLSNKQRFLRLHIAVSDLLSLLDVPGGLHNHPEAILQTGEVVDSVGATIMVGDAGNLIQTTDGVIVSAAAPLLSLNVGIDLKIIDQEDAQHSVNVVFTVF